VFLLPPKKKEKRKAARCFEINQPKMLQLPARYLYRAIAILIETVFFNSLYSIRHINITLLMSTRMRRHFLELNETGSSIKRFILSGLKALDSLGLAHNHLREVPGRVFFHLTQLNSLELDGNQITHVDANAFIGLEGKCNRNLIRTLNPLTANARVSTLKRLDQFTLNRSFSEKRRGL